MPFALRRVGGAWRVEAEPYFLMINPVSGLPLI